MTTIFVAALALGIPMAAVAEAPDQSGVVEQVPTELRWLWAGDGVVVLEGPPIEEGCLDEGFDEFTETVVNTPAGVVTGTSTHTDQVWVFDDEGFEDPLDWLLGRACPAVIAGQSAPEPLAHGEGRVSMNTRVDADGGEHIRMRVTAKVTTADGRTVHLNAHGELGVVPDFVHYGG